MHIVVAGFKRAQSTGLPQVIAVNDWMIYLSAHSGDLLMKLGMALIGLFGLIYAVGVDEINATSAFLVGYSLDSFVGLFGNTLDRRASAQLAALRGQLGGETAEGK